MKRILRCVAGLWALAAAVMALPVVTGATPVVAILSVPPTDGPVQVETQSVAAVLPLTCSGNPAPAVCVYGYVYYDGAPVTGASVRIESVYGALNTTTGSGTLSSSPYFQASLSGAPLLASPGDSITVTASYNGRTAGTQYVVANGGQQVDVVLVQSFDDWWDQAYAYRRPLAISTDSALGAGTTIKVDGMDLDLLVTQGKARPDHNDFRIARRISTNNWIEIARVYYTGWDLEFQLAATINAGVDSSYYLYYGNPYAGSAPTFSRSQGWWVDMYRDKWWSEFGGTWTYNTTMNFDNVCDDSGLNHDGKVGSSFDESEKFRGRLYIPYTGTWTFRVYTNDGYRVYIDDAGVGEFDGYETSRWVTVGSISLKSGWHKMELRNMWVNCGPWKFYMEGPSFPNQLVPANYFQLIWDGVKTGVTPGSEEARLTYNPPIVTFNYMNPNFVVQQGQTITLIGSATDNDEQGNSITQYVWRSDLNGVLGTQALLSINAASLTVGTHTIYFKAKDNEGVWSDEIGRQIVVTSPLPPPTPITTPTPVPTATPAGPGATWTFMLYLDGDTGGGDGVFPSMAKAIQRLEQSPSPRVKIVALLDGPNTLDTFRVTFNPLATYQPLGEKRMDDPATLIDFVQQAQRDFPANYYYLAIANHANGIDGIAWDTTTRSDRTALITPAELRQALVTITNNGARPLDVLHYDGCSFGLLENAHLAAGLARYLVASQNTMWGWFLYDQYRSAVGTSTTPATLAKAIGRLYADKATLQQAPYTIGVLDLGRMSNTIAALNSLTDGLAAFADGSQANRMLLNTIRSQTQKTDSGGNPALTITNEDTYLDLVDFAARVKLQVTGHGVPTAANNLIQTITGSQPLVAYESHRSGTWDYFGERITWNLDGARGVSIYYPLKAAGAKYGDYATGLTYPAFHSASRWRNYLQAGVPPLAPGDPLPQDRPEPLAPLVSRANVYLPIIRR